MGPHCRYLYSMLAIWFAVGVRGELDASQTLLWGEGLSEARAGEISTFHLQTRDSTGVNVSAALYEILVVCVSDAPAVTDFCSVDPVVIEEGGGAFRVEFVVGRFWAEELDPWTEGIYPNPLPVDFFSQTTDRLRVKVGGSPVSGSPFTPLFLGEDAIDPENCLISNSIQFLYAGVPGGAGEWQQLRDSFGNSIGPSDVLDHVEGKITLVETTPWSSNEGVDAVVQATWILTNWYIDFQVTCYVAGRYRFEALYGDAEKVAIPIESSLDTSTGTSVLLDCVPGSIRAIELSVDGGVEIGSVVQIHAQAYDAYGNHAYLGDAIVDGAMIALEDQAVDDIEVEVLHTSCDCELLTSLNVELDNSSPGRLNIEFVTEVRGSHRVHVRYDGTDYVQDPFGIVIVDADAPQSPQSSEQATEGLEPTEAPETAREVDASTSSIDAGAIAVDGEVSLKAGEIKTFLVILRDSQNEEAEGEVADLASWLINRVSPMQGLTQLTRYLVDDNSMDRFIVEIRAELATIYYLLVTYKGVPIEHEISSVLVQPSDDISPEKTIIVGSAIGVEVGMEQYYVAEEYRQIAGRNMSLILTAVDPYGNSHRTTKPGFTLNKNIHSAATWFQTFEFGDGQTRLYFAIEETGFYDLRAKLDEATVYESRLEIGPEVVSPSNSRVSGLESVTAGENGEGLLQVQDLYGNIYDAVYQSLINLTQFHISLRQGGSEETVSVVYTGFDEEESAVVFRYNLTQSAVYTLSAFWEHWPMQGDRESIRVLPADISFEESEAKLLQTTVSAGELIVVQIVGRDIFRNLVSEDSNLVNRTQLRLIRFVDGSPLDVSIREEGISSSIVEARTRITVTGFYLFELEIDGRLLSVEEAKLTVTPSDLSEETSGIEYQEEVKVGEWNTVVFFARDVFGNAIVDGLNFTLSIQDVNATVEDFAKSDIYGQLLARYRIYDAGNFSVDIHQGDAHLKRFHIVATPNESATQSTGSACLCLMASQLLVLFIGPQWKFDRSVVMMFVAAAALILLAYWFLTREEAEQEGSEDTASDSEALEIHSDFGDSAKELASACDESADIRIKAFRPAGPSS